MNRIYIRSWNDTTLKFSLRKLSDPWVICFSGSLLFISDGGRRLVHPCMFTARQLASFRHLDYIRHLYRVTLSSFMKQMDLYNYVCDVWYYRVLVFCLMTEFLPLHLHYTCNTSVYSVYVYTFFFVVVSDNTFYILYIYIIIYIYIYIYTVLYSYLQTPPQLKNL